MNELIAKRNKVSDELRELNTVAKAEERDLTEDEQTRWDTLLSERDRLTRQIDRDKVEDGITESESRSMGVVEKPQPATVYAEPKPDNPWRSFGEFLGAVYRAAVDPGSTDRRLTETRQLGMSEGLPQDGGFLVQTDHVTELLKRVYETGVLANRVRRYPVSANANSLTINAVAETSRATGARWGGIQAYWLAEAGTKTPSNPTFRRMRLELNKLIGLCYATDELLQDTVALDAVVKEAFTEEFGFMVDDAILRGTGVGQPLGILNSPALVTVPLEAGQVAGTLLAENIMQMRSRLWAKGRANSVWFVNQDVEPLLHSLSLAVGMGGVPVYMPAGGLSGSPYDTLYGRPVIPIEQASTFGQVGDIVLADLNQYLMIDKGGIQQATSIHVAFTTDETAFRFVYRVDGQPGWNAPLTPAQGANTLSPFVTLAAR